MATLGKKRNRPTLEARMRGLAGQARKVELAEPAIRAYRQAQQLTRSGRSQTGLGTNQYAVTDSSDRWTHGAGRRAATGHAAQPQLPQSYAETARSELSKLSDDEPKRTALLTQKKLDNDGEWDLIVQYNQREGRRIAAMAAQEINKKKEENKKFLDQQVLEHERRRKKEERAKMEFIRQQKERLRRLEEEEARKDAARAERALRVKAEQDEAAQLVRERKAKEKEKQRRDDMAMLKRIDLENQKAREKEQAKLLKEKARAKELKDDLVRQLGFKAEQKKFEAEEERQLQIAARKRQDEEERKRKEALLELQEKMKSKQKIGESLAADVQALARADEERALREQAAYDERKRKEEADKIRSQQMQQMAQLESLEQQLRLKKEKAMEENRQRQKEAITLAADAEKAHNESLAQLNVEANKKKEYYKQLTEHIEQKKELKMKGVGMSKNERNFNSKVLAKMSLEMGY